DIRLQVLAKLREAARRSTLIRSRLILPLCNQVVESQQSASTQPARWQASSYNLTVSSKDPSLCSVLNSLNENEKNSCAPAPGRRICMMARSVSAFVEFIK